MNVYALHRGVVGVLCFHGVPDLEVDVVFVKGLEGGDGVLCAGDELHEAVVLLHQLFVGLGRIIEELEVLADDDLPLLFAVGIVLCCCPCDASGEGLDGGVDFSVHNSFLF